MQGKRIKDVVNRMHVAMPQARDRVSRPPVIPPRVAQARAARDAGYKPPTEKDLQVYCDVKCTVSRCYMQPAVSYALPLHVAVCMFCILAVLHGHGITCLHALLIRR